MIFLIVLNVNVDDGVLYIIVHENVIKLYCFKIHGWKVYR